MNPVFLFTHKFIFYSLVRPGLREEGGPRDFRTVRPETPTTPEGLEYGLEFYGFEEL